MYCHKCGSQLPDGSVVCPVCGASEKPQKKKKRKLWIWIVAAAILFAGCARSFNSVPSGSANSEETAKPQNTAAETAKPTKEPEQTAVPITVLELGDTYSCNGLDFCVTNVVFSNYAGNLPNYNKADDDYIYCVVYITVTNTTNETKELQGKVLTATVSDYGFSLLYDGEAKYNQSFGKYTDFLFGNDKILPLATLTDKVLNYKVPVLIQNSENPLELRFSFKSEALAAWVLR